MRIAIALGLVAAAVAANAKPVDAPESAREARYLMRGVRACIAAHPPGPSRDPEDAFVAHDCRCAVDRFIAGRNTADLPPLRNDPKLIEEAFASCRAERAGGQAPATATAEVDRGAKDPDAATSPGASPDLWTWLSGLDPVGWLGRSGLPTWAWGVIAAFVLLLMLKLRGRRDRGDLIAPPRSIRPPARVNPVSDEGES
jgi:hypothetical protein